MEVTKLATALVKAQGALKNPAMDATNPHFRSKFASLKSVQQAVLPVFNKNGLAIVQRGVTQDGGIGINTVILHESGEVFDAGTISIPVQKSDAQAYMSAVTYARRYGLQTAAGCVGDPDDDGNATKEDTPKKKPAPKKDTTKHPGDFHTSMDKAKEMLGEDLYREVLGTCGYADRTEIPADGRQLVLDVLREKYEQIKEGVK